MRNTPLARRALLSLLSLFLPIVMSAAAQPARAARAVRARLTSPCSTTGTYPYLHTCGPFIENYQGQPVRLLAVNWYGFESNDFVVSGLDTRSFRDIIATIKMLGYNALRLPFSNQMVEQNPVVSALTQTCPQGAPASACRSVDGQGLLAANPDLYGLTSLQILKSIVDYAGSQGLYIILDDHRSRAGWGPQEDGLWYDTAYGYTPSNWLGDWQRLAQLFAGDSALTGVDLFNEPHSLGQPVTCTDYLSSGHGATWGTCNGQSNPVSDWRAAAAMTGNALLSIDPNLMVVVEGTSVAPNARGLLDTTGAGSNLEAAGVEPVQLNVSGHLVYSAHGYVWNQDNADRVKMMARWTDLFGYLMNPAAAYATPVWVGEFGTCNNDPSCAYDATPGAYGFWFDTFVQYINTPPYLGAPPFGWAVWALNGTSPDAYDFTLGKWVRGNGDRELYGVLNTAWTDLSLPALQGEIFSGVELPVAPTDTATATPPATLIPLPTDTPVPTPTNIPRPTPTPKPSQALRVDARGLLAHGRVRFDLLARRDTHDRLWGRFPYADTIHRLTVQALRIDGLILRCRPSRQARVTGLARDGHGRRYRFAVWVSVARAGRMTFTIHLSNGFQFGGDALGRASFSCQ